MENNPLLGPKPTKWKNPLTVEPTMLISTLTAILSDSLFQNLMLTRTCPILNANGTCATEMESQISVSQLNSVKLFGKLMLGILTTSYVGSLIDQNVKYIRWCICLPAVGQVLCDMLNFANVVFWSWSPLVMTVYNFLILGLSGSSMTMMMMNTAYVSHTSTKQERTGRVGYLMVSFSLGNGIGYLCSGFVVEYLGFRNGFLACIGLQLVALILVTILIEDIKSVCEEKLYRGGIIRSIVEGFKVLKKQRPYNKRLMIYLLVFAFSIIHCYPYGELSVMYLFLKYQFNLSPVDFGVYMLYSMAVESIGTLFSTEVLKKRLQLHDATVGILGSIFEVTVSLSWLRVSQAWQIYVVTSLALFEKAVLSATLSLASKCVDPEEYGRLTSIFGVSNFMVPIAILVYNAVYEMAIYTYPKAIFLVSTALSTPLIFIFIILLSLTKQLPLAERNIEKPGRSF